MSTKVTVAHHNSDDDTDFHLYLECAEAEAIYLRLDNAKWYFDGKRVTVRIPQEVFEKIATEKNLKILKNHSESINEWKENGFLMNIWKKDE